ncbi:MAG: alginate lyase family protein [Acidobacteriota bacterium]|nr:MAG: alginate lyase family protein [Acidobacteriota bacterium]
MRITAVKLKKLRSMSLGEVKGRAHQEFVKLADCLLLDGAVEMSDGELYREFRSESRNGSQESPVRMLIRRMRAGEGLILPSLAERRGIIEIMHHRFASEVEAIVAAAERALEGRFDLLGYTDLDFGKPVDWHLDPRTGGRVPLRHWSLIAHIDPICDGDWKVFLEVQRQPHLITLGQAWRLTGDDRFARGIVEQITSWIDANPVGRGAGWSGSLDVAFRAIGWLWALEMSIDSPVMTDQFLARAIKSLIEHGRHIEKFLSYYSSPNTHLTGEALGLFCLGVALPELRRSGNWRSLGLRILLDQLPKQVRDDGVYFEQSSYYHRYTADFYTHLYAISRAHGLAIEEERMLVGKLEGLFEFLMWIKRPDDTWPIFGDDDGGRLLRLAPRAGNDFRDTLAIGAALFDRGDWKHAAGEAPAELLWLLGPEGLERYDRLESAMPAGTSRPFETSGFFVARSGWERDSDYLLIDCGRHGAEMGPCHAHSDALSIELAMHGTSWLVDPASYVYGADPETRDWFRSTPAHNTATVDGESQSIPSTPFAWRTSANCVLKEFSDRGPAVVFEGAHDGYRRLNDPVTHIRSVVVPRDRHAVILHDRFEALEAHTYALRFHFAPGCEAAARDGFVEARMSNGETLLIHLFPHGGTEIRTGIEDGWVSICYGQRTQAPVAVFTASGRGVTEMTTVILACRGEGEGISR